MAERAARQQAAHGQVEELLWEFADQLEPEDGMLWKDLIAAALGMTFFASLRMT